MIAALYVATDGVYFDLPNVDPWDIKRDARQYDGPHPVIAHPPCQLWIAFAALNYKRWGGEHNRPGNDGGCFLAALTAVRKFGGVLEHPAGSKAWQTYGLQRPRHGWTQTLPNEYTCEVWQSAYGHKAQKRTWLFYAGDNPPQDLNWERKPGTHQVGIGWDPKKPVLSKREASATPVAFRNALIALAHNARKDKRPGY